MRDNIEVIPSDRCDLPNQVASNDSQHESYSWRKCFTDVNIVTLNPSAPASTPTPALSAAAPQATARLGTNRIVLVIAAGLGYETFVMAVRTAFLTVSIEEGKGINRH